MELDRYDRAIVRLLQQDARITNTLLNGLITTDKTIGLETMCIGGGQGMAMIIERLN